MEIYLKKTTTNWTLNSWETYEAKIGEFRQMFTAMEALALVEKKDTAFGLILQKIFIITVFSGLKIKSCKIHHQTHIISSPGFSLHNKKCHI